MLLLDKYPDMLAHAAAGLAPHDVAFYLRELAASYHSYYDAEPLKTAIFYATTRTNLLKAW